MTSTNGSAPFIVVGAGLAGLAAARHLHAHGHAVRVLEAGDDIGGRVRTDDIDGYLLDRGFQLYNPAYPESRRVLDHAALDLRPFVAGAEIVLRTRRARVADPRREPTWAWSSLCAPLGPLPALARFGTYAATRATSPPARLRAEPDITAAQALRAAGVSDELLERLLRPFLSGVFLESGLQTSRHFMDLVLRSFVRGTPSVPARGMGRIPHNLARNLPAEAVLTGTPVIEVSANQVRTSHGSIPAQGVIVATDPATAGRLLPGLAVPEGRAVTTWYHSVAGQTLTSGRSVLVLDGTGTGPLVNSVALSHAAPAYAPQGRTLVSSSALGVHPDDDSERAVRGHLARLYDTDTRDWQLLATYPIEYALPAMSVPLEPRKPVRLAPGIYVAGDHRDTASIQGALVSGRRAAQAAIVDREGPR